MSSSSLFSKIQALVKQEGTSNAHSEDLFLKTGAGYEKLNIKELLFAKANEKHVELHFASFKKKCVFLLQNLPRKTCGFNC